jgi:hypothetical protein
MRTGFAGNDCATAPAEIKGANIATTMQSVLVFNDSLLRPEGYHPSFTPSLHHRELQQRGSWMVD